MCDTRFPCACCGFLTMLAGSHDSLDICPVCYWEDDPVQYEDPSLSGGANVVSLNAARENYLTLGASDPRHVEHVRKPHADEVPTVEG